MSLRSAGALGALLLSVALAACGGNSKPSKSEYISKADKICKSDGVKIDAAASKLGQNSTNAEFAAFQKAAVPLLEAENKSLRALEKPKGDDATLNALYDEVEVATAKVKAAPPAKVAAIFQGNGPFAKANKGANAYGMKVCGK